MRHITITLDDDLDRRVRAKAAGRGTSVSAVPRAFLTHWVREETEFARLKRLQDEALPKIRNFRAADRLSRNAIHERTP